MLHDRPASRLTASGWLSGFNDWYLSDFVPSGGSVVRFVSGTETVLTQVRTEIERIAEQGNFHYRFLDADNRRPDGRPPQLHRIERFYAAVTEQVDWQGWAQAQARNVLERLGLRIPLGTSLDDIQAIAEANKTDRDYLIQQYQAEARRSVQDRAMTVEFRNAITNLWVDQLLPDTSTPGRSDVLTAWLGGEPLPPGGARVLSRCQIFGRISSINARHYLVSFCEWSRRVGRTGILIVLDFRAYERTGRAGRAGATGADIKSAIDAGATLEDILRLLAQAETESDALRYGKQSYEQMLSLLRRFIDEVDRFPSLALIVLTSPQYFGVDERVRRYTDYVALNTRIGDEVADRHRANPDAAVVRLSEGI